MSRGREFGWWLFAAAFLLSSPLDAATYYIANTGDDAADGLTETTPWQTIERVNAQSGDGHTFLFKRGDVFRGEITANGRQITYGPYGTGDRPVIKGSMVITNWTWDAARNCYVADNTNTFRHLFVNGELMRIARYPNVDAPDLGWLRTDSGSSKNTFYDAALGSYGKPANYWVGATVRIRSYSWLFEMRAVASSTSSGTVTLSSDLTDTGGSTISPGWGYYLDGLLGELDHENEWCAAAGKVYLSPPGGANPNTLLVEGMHYENGIYINWNKTGMLVENLAFAHQVDAAVDTVYTDGATIRNCYFRQCEEAGVKIGYASANVTVENNIFEDMLNFAVAKYLSGTNGPGTTIIQSNLISRTALVAGYGQDGSMQSEGIRCIGGGAIIRRNVIEDIGYVGIGLDEGGSICEENIVRRAQLLLDDGGTIDINSHSNIVRRNLIFDTYGNRDISNGESQSGWVHGQMGFCIFTQPNDNANIIEQNTLANNTGGILLDTTQNSRVRSNVVYNTIGDTTGVYAPWHINLLANYSPIGMGDQITDNIFYSLSSTQGFIKAMTSYDSAFIDRNYYCNPYGAVQMSEIYPDHTPYANYTLAEWRARYPARDQNSVTSRVAFPTDAITGVPREDSKLFVNTNAVTTFFSFGGNEYQDLDGNPVTGGIMLDPFRSAVLVLRFLAPPATNTQPVAADFDGDQLADPTTLDGSGIWRVWRSSLGYARVQAALGQAGWIPLAGDFDGDRLADPAIYHSAFGWYAWLSSAGYQAVGLMAFNASGYAPVVADFDGDSLADLAIFGADGWYVKFSGNDYAGSAGPFLPVPAGITVTPVAADFDGDGLADPALFKEGWYLWLSSQHYALSGSYLAISSDSSVTALAADFDGDGRADPAVVIEGAWYLWLSGSAYQLHGPLNWSP